MRRLSLPGSLVPGYQARISSPNKGRTRVLVLTLLQIVGYLISIVVTLVIVQFVMSLLISFNVINMHNDFVAAIWRAVNALLDPLLRPIRRFMPDTGAIDFSPMVLIIVLQIVQIVLRNAAVGLV